MPDRTPYDDAQLRARALAGALAERLVHQLIADLSYFGDAVLAELAGLRLRSAPDRRRAFQASHAAILSAAAALDDTLAASIAQGTVMTFDQVEVIYRAAQRQAAAFEDAGLGASRLPKITLFGAYRGGADSWRTTLRGYVDNAAAELDRIIRLGLLRDIPPRALAAKLRPYVRGAETFYQAFAGRDDALQAMRQSWRTLPEALRGAAREIHYNARRIAESEVHATRLEATRQHGLSDPLVAGYRWTLSPDRGLTRVPDICDALASNDFYGGGPGWYPKTSVPMAPHPFCRCGLTPTMRPFAQITDPLPHTRRTLKFGLMQVGKIPPRRAVRTRAQLERMIRASETPLSPNEHALLTASYDTARRWRAATHVTVP